MAKQTIKKPYKTGETPEIGDLVWRYIASVFEDENPKKDWGVVVKLWVSTKGSWQLPIIYWARKGRAQKSLVATVQLEARAK